MSYPEAPDGSRQTLFGEGGGAATAESLQTSLLAQIPIDPDVRLGCDQDPDCRQQSDSAAAQAFFKIAQQVIDQLYGSM